MQASPDSKVHGANVGSIWGRQDPGGPHVGPMNFAIWEHIQSYVCMDKLVHLKHSNDVNIFILSWLNLFRVNLIFNCVFTTMLYVLSFWYITCVNLLQQNTE